MPRAHEFESLRGLLAVWVIVHHTILTAGLHSENWPFPFNLFGKGGYAVDVFIILSGFVIFSLMDNQPETYGKFIVRRAFRLYPVYLISLGTSAFLTRFYISTLKALPVWHPHTAERLRIFSDTLRYYWPHLIAHILLLHGLVPDRILPSSDYAFVGAAWSITLEWQFYLIAPLCFLLVHRKNISGLFAFVFLLLLLRHVYPGGMGFLPNNMHLFFAGILAYYGYRFVIRHKEALKPAAPVVTALPPLFTLLLIPSIPMVLFSAVYAVILVAVLMPEKIAVRVMSWLFDRKPLLYAGRISYCLYLTHVTALFVCAHFLTRFFHDQWTFFAALLGSTLTLTFIASALLSRYVEYPCMAFGKRLVHGGRMKTLVLKTA